MAVDLTIWKDITTFSQTDKMRIPTTFQATNGNISITITNGHIDYQPNWIMRCTQLDMCEVQLNDVENLYQAKIEAVRLVQNKLLALTRNAGIIKIGTKK